jgi:rhodanese-related sulfurtransferase
MTLFLTRAALTLALSLSSVAAFAQTAPAAAPAAAQAVTPQNDPAYTYKTLRLNRAAFDALAANPEHLVVLDLRRPDELEKVGGFPVYLSIQTGDVQKSLGYIPRDRLIVTVSNRAHRAGAVGDILSGLGYRVVGAIGVLDYQDEGGTLVKIAPPPPRAAAVAAAPVANAAPPAAAAAK